MKRSGIKGKTGRPAGVLFSLCAAFLLTACAGEGQASDQMAPGTDWQAQRKQYDRRTVQDRRISPVDEAKIESVDLNACKGTLILAGSGDIRLSGSLEGSVVVDTAEDELVHLYLDGVEINAYRGPALRIEEAAKVVVTLMPGTENVLTDSPDYVEPQGGVSYEEMPACLYSVCDLTVNGDGALRVYGYYEDGIRSKDRIRLLGGSVSVQAKGDGIRGNDGILIQDASVEVQSEKNGIRATAQGENDRGVIEVKDSTVSVVAGEKGVYTASDLYLYDSRCSVNAVEEKVKAGGTACIAGDCLNQ